MGRQRTNNEDAYVAEQLDQDTILAIAIDGVGGYEGGEVAAEIAQTEIPKYLHDFRNGERLELLKQAVVYANNAIFDRRQVDAARSSMSCVLTSAIIDAKRKVVDMVHVGDTRLYQYHHGELIKLSHDHSLIGYREEMGDLTEEQAMHHPQRNVISRDVGSAKHEIADRDFLEATEFPLLPNSIFLFCSDGLTDLITSKQIISILEKSLSLNLKAQELIDAANEAGGKDNVTVVLVEYQAEEKSEAKKPEKKDVKPQKLDEEVKTEVVSNVPEVSPRPENKSKNMKKFNIFAIVAIIILALCCGAAFLYIYKVDKKLNDLQSNFENHLLCSEFEGNDSALNDSIGVLNEIIAQKDSIIKALR